MADPHADEPDIAQEFLQHLIELWRAGGLRLGETARGSGVHRFSFRAGGWPIVVDLDTTVLEMRAYHQRDGIATRGVPARVMRALVTEDPKGDGSVKDALDALRGTVRRWKQDNARLYVRSPDVARHPDGWNRA